MRATFGALAPDQPDLMNGNLEDAVNCIPFEQSYGPFNGPAVYSASISSTCVGAYSTKSIGGVAVTFAATATKLFKETSGVITDVTRASGGAYAATANWEFETFGNTLHAVDGVDAMQFWTLDTSTKFANMSTSASAPIAFHIAAIRDFVMVGREPLNQNRVRWCQITNSSRWTGSVPYQSDFQDFPGSSTVRKITGGDFAGIVTENSFWRGSYVGSPLVFRFDEICPGIGTTFSGLVARFQQTTFMYTTRGWYAVDGQQGYPIGQGSIDEFFADDFESGSAANCSSVIDPVNKLFIAYYPSVQGSGRLLIYSFGAQKWARAEVNLDFLFSALSAGYNLDNMDALMPSIDAAGAISLDSDVWKGGLKALSGFNFDHRMVKFNSTPLTARFITGEAQLVQDSRAFVRAIRPLVEGTVSTSVQAFIGGRDRLIDSVSFTSAVALNSIGACPFRANNRYQRLRIDVSGGFSRAYGADVDVVSAGVR